MKISYPVRKVINVLAFQAGWFAAVLGAGHGMPWLGIVVVPIVLGLHLALSPDWKPELLLALSAAAMGFGFDTMLVSAGVFAPVLFLFPEPFSPPWMVMLWVNFATTLNVSLGFLRGKYFFAGILGALGGPAAYYSGARLGAMTEMPGAGDLAILTIAWAAAVPLLYRVAKLINDRFSKRGA